MNESKYNDGAVDVSLLRVTHFFNLSFKPSAVFVCSGYKKSLCGGAWSSLAGEKNAFAVLSSNQCVGTGSTAELGCCAGNQRIESTDECKSCPIGKMSAEDEATECT